MGRTAPSQFHSSTQSRTKYSPSHQFLSSTGNTYLENYDRSESRDLEQIPCVVYLHSQGGSRLEGKFLIDRCMENRICLCLFDFQGCGVSSGDFVSLGLYEQHQVERVINNITEKYRIGTVGLWGRSMGAATSILFAENNGPRLAAMVPLVS